MNANDGGEWVTFSFLGAELAKKHSRRIQVESLRTDLDCFRPNLVCFGTKVGAQLFRDAYQNQAIMWQKHDEIKSDAAL
jgi:hypothetical protein